MSVTNFSSINDLFSSDIDDLADLPAFEVPPPGVYLLEVKFQEKVINNKNCIEMACKVIETQELEDVNNREVPPNTEFSQLFMLNNEFGLGSLKEVLKPLSEHFGVTNLGILLRENLQEYVQVVALVKNRTDKSDPDKKYARVSIISVA